MGSKNPGMNGFSIEADSISAAQPSARLVICADHPSTIGITASDFTASAKSQLRPATFG
jgi:hypothetical protein